MSEPASLPLGVAAGLLGGYRWIEHRLFEVTGAWALDETVPAAQLHLDEAALAHAWHADLWADRLPVLDGVDPEALTVPSGPVAGPLVAALDATGSADVELHGARTVRRLAGLYRVVLPRLVATYLAHTARSAPAADRPVRRVLRLVVRDEVEAVLAGEAVLQDLLRTPEAAAAAAAAQQRLEALVVASGPGTGLLPWPTLQPP